MSRDGCWSHRSMARRARSPRRHVIGDRSSTRLGKAGVLATLGSDQQVQVWRAGEPTAVEIDDVPGGAYALAVSPDGSRLAVGDGDGAVRLVSAATGERAARPRAAP